LNIYFRSLKFINDLPMGRPQGYLKKSDERPQMNHPPSFSHVDAMHIIPEQWIAG
jgi:hypothetical protein